MRTIVIFFTKLHCDPEIEISDMLTFNSNEHWFTVTSKLGITYSYRLEHIIGYKITPASVSD